MKKQRIYCSFQKVVEIKLNLKTILLEELFILSQNVTDNSKEKELMKMKQLIDKYNSLLDK